MFEDDTASGKVQHLGKDEKSWSCEKKKQIYFLRLKDKLIDNLGFHLMADSTDILIGAILHYKLYL